MVDVGGSFCIDRYEGSLTAVPSTPEEPDPPRLALSPYYHPATRLAERDHRFWDHWRRHLGPYTARQIELPSLPSWRSAITYVVRAESLQGVVPSAYVDLEVARRACANAGKRLCTLREWTTACRGEDGTRYPYGSRYEKGRCNVGRPHPATRLHGMRSPNYHDPRLNLVTDDGHPLLRETGTTPDCRSIWNGDSAYDMVGNLDEWIEDPDGTFVGGFYARDTEWGCDARIQVHSPDYYDYSLGVRCCR